MLLERVCVSTRTDREIRSQSVTVSESYTEDKLYKESTIHYDRLFSRAIRYDRLAVLRVQTRHNTTDIHDLNQNRGTTDLNQPNPCTKRSTGTDQPIYFTRTDPKQVP